MVAPRSVATHRPTRYPIISATGILGQLLRHARQAGTLIILALFLSRGLVAQELTPRAYWPAPKGTKVVTLGYSHVSGDVVPDPSLPVTGVDSKIDTLNLGYLQTISLWGRTANIVVSAPYSDGDTSGDGNFGERLNREYKGLGDVSVSLSVNFMGAPTMTPEQFQALLRNPKPIIGGSLKLVAPTGDYDSDKLINVGANRWAMKAELGVILPLNTNWLIEAAIGSWFFEDNDDFFAGLTREQKPIAAVQAHLIRTFNSGLWLSLDGSYYKGGRSTVEGRKLDDLQRDSKLGITMHYPITRRNVVKLGYSIGSVIDSDEDFGVVVLTYSRIL